jgi:hypothetical protein
MFISISGPRRGSAQVGTAPGFSFCALRADVERTLAASFVRLQWRIASSVGRSGEL